MIKKFLLLVFLLAALPAAAQVTTATISGRIVDENGPVEGVTVVAIHQPTNAQYYATTDRRGWYQLLDVLPGGPYTVRIHYFGYNPLTVRNLHTFVGQNLLVDADLEAGTTRVRSDEAASSLRIGPGLNGAAVPVSPLGFDLVGQTVAAPVPFDVRQEASLSGASRLQTVPTGSSRLHGSAYGYFGSGEHLGLNLSAPLFSQDYLLFAGLEYDGVSGFNGAGRFDARLSGSQRLDLSGGRLDGTDSWAAAGLTSSIFDGHASNRAQAQWNSDPAARQLTVSDDFTWATGSQRLLLGAQFARGDVFAAGASADSSFSRVDVYVQDAVRLGSRMTLLAGVRFCFPFAFSPRVSLYYDLSGNGKAVLRAGTAVYGVHGEGTVWKNLAAIDLQLPAAFRLSLEGIYGQSWRKAFYISSRNVLDSRYDLTARLERPLADRFWAVGAYTRSDGLVRDRIVGGLSYRAEYAGRFATTASVLYRGYGGEFPDVFSSQYPTPVEYAWMNCLEACVSQDLGAKVGGRLHTLRLTAYFCHDFSGHSQVLAGLRYVF